MIIPSAEPFFFPGNNIGCLLVHGFTGAPKEMRWLGEYLNKVGYSVLGVRLAGHATKPEDMARMHWEDWIASIEDGYFLLSGMVNHIFIIGLSLGGILSIQFAAHHPVSGLVTMSVPYAMPDDPRLPFIRPMSLVMPFIKQGPDEFHNPEAAKDHVSYPVMPTKSVIQLRDLLIEMRSSLPKISVPVLVIHSRNDIGVPPENAEKIYAALNTTQKHLFYVENSGHVIPREPDRELAFKAIDDFINHVTGADTHE
jgi:carboxylesterase